LRFTYVGEFDVQWDDAFGLGLYYMHARHYSPTLGRFLQPDPDASEANLYAYTANNPVTELDPDGTCFILCIVIGVALFGGLGATAEVATYAMTTPSDDWSGEGAAGAATSGAISGALLAVPGGRVAGVPAKVLSKVPRAARVVSNLRSVSQRYDWGNVRARQGPAEWRPNAAFPRGREYKELTHAFIPRRASVPNFIKNSGWNLREKWGTNHALSDPSRYRFMPRSWKNSNPPPGPVRRTWSRMPAD